MISHNGYLLQNIMCSGYIQQSNSLNIDLHVHLQTIVGVFNLQIDM